MNRLALSLTAVAACAAGLTAFAPARSAEQVAVEGAVKDYVEAFYKAAPDRLARSVSADLKKMGYWRQNAESAYKGPLHMTFDEATALAGEWNVEGRQGEDLRYEIDVFEVLDKIANAKVTAKWGVDYFQLVKEEDRWVIHHVLWQSHPPKSGK